MAAGPLRGPAARAVRGAGLPLRQPEAVLPEVEDAGQRRRIAGRPPERRGGADRLRRDRGAAPELREGARRPRPFPDDRTSGDLHMTTVLPARPVGGRLIDQFEYGLDAPICLTWELTYACNLACR